MTIRARSSIRTKMVAGTMVLFLLGFGILLTTVFVRTSTLTRQLAVQQGKAQATADSNGVRTLLAAAVATGSSVARSMGQLKTAGVTDRAVYDRLLRSTLADNPQYIALSSGWLPNALDGRDRKYRKTPGSDATGRYLPYWNRGTGSIELEPLVDYDTPGAGDYFLVPMRTGKEWVMDPYIYPVAGKNVLMTSVMSPITVDNRRVGVVGIDIPLANLQTQIGRIKPYRIGYATLTTSAAVAVANPNTALAGKKLTDPAVVAATVRAAAGNRPVVLTGHDPVLGRDAIRIFVPVEVSPGANWVFSVSLPADGVLAQQKSLRRSTIVLASVLVVIAFLAALLRARSLARPLQSLTARMTELADTGDLSQRVDDTRRDEIGALGTAFNRFTAAMAEVVRAVQEEIGGLGRASDQIGAISQRMVTSSAHADSQVQSLASSAGQVTSNAQTVAAAVEEMSTSIQEISAGSTDAARVAAEAVAQAEAAAGTVSRLDSSGEQIGKVVELITQIAGQTNLLALNATIEAARAGASGRGFAVVANEVKELARQTAQATEDITTKVASIRSDTAGMVTVIRHIGEIITQIDDTQTSIASAVEEQTATTREIGRSATEAATAAGSISGSVVSVSEATDITRADADAVEQAATVLAGLTGTLRQAVSQLRV